jgi:hypothetical protein
VAAKITVSLEVPIEWNDLRKKFNVTWRDIIKQGLNTMDSTTKDKIQDPAISIHLKTAVESIMHAWNIIKERNTP